MSADTTSNPPNVAATESKGSRKKKTKAEAATATPAKPESEAGGDATTQDGKVNGVENASDSPYIKELQKSIRNVNKKLNSMQKVDSIIAENPDQSLDDLVAARKINADQKAQALKKPALLAQLAQLEEQITQYKKFDQEYQQKMSAERELLQSFHKQELEKLRETMKAEAAIEAQKTSKQCLLVLAKYLRAAAERRQRVDDETDLAKGFEGVLSMVYSGDASAVAIMEKLIDGVEEPITAVDGTQLKITYAEVKRTAEEESPFAAEEAWADDVAQADPAPPEVDVEDAPVPTTDAETDPTVANAGLTEVDDTTTQIPTGGEETVELPSAPANASVDDGAANAAGEEQWDSKAPGSDDPLAESFEMIPRDPAETETPVTATDGANVQSWADDAANEAASNEAIATSEPTTTANASNGFREVHHGRGGRGRGGFQSDQRGGFRGRGGPRGEGRGGRGGFRGDRGRGRGGARGGRGRGDSAQ